jgi:predicted nucleic acid-binding protein
LISERAVVLDTCVLINLLATGQIVEIAPVVAPTCLVCSAVSQESLYLRTLEADAKPELVNLGPLFTAGTLSRTVLQGDAEEELYVTYALELDDGEAMSLAIAQSRNLTLATDDRKARRVIRENAPHLSVISTSDIIHAWSETRERAAVVEAVRLIQSRARFRPSAPDPLTAWWEQLLDG